MTLKRFYNACTIISVVLLIFAALLIAGTISADIRVWTIVLLAAAFFVLRDLKE